MNRSGLPVQFGERFRTRTGLPNVDRFLHDTSNQAGPGGQSASEVAGAVTSTGAIGLSSTGPQSFMAAFVLNTLNSIGLGSVAAWMAGHPLSGASTLSTIADVLTPGEVANKLTTPK
jgi:hypothetical protein